MCEINKGDIVYLVKGGKVLLPNGTTHQFDKCKWNGGRVILGIEEVKPKYRSKLVVKKKEILSDAFSLDGDLVDLGEYKLEPIEMTLSQNDIPIPVPTPPPSYTVPFTMIGACLMYFFKKVSGLDRKLNHVSCEIRHQEAITRIAKLEGKVLRKQIVDGGKKVKSKIDERKKENEQQV